MKKDEAMEVLKYLNSNYSTFNNIEEKFKFWAPTLIQYDYQDVIRRINELTQRKEFATICPTLSAIVSPLTKSENKFFLEDKLFSCQFCGRVFNSTEEMIKHEDRCRSVRYIERQYQRFNLGNVDKKELYNMSDNVFQEKYLKLLKLVQSKTNNESEKSLIECCFNAPSPDKAKAIIGG